MSAPLSTAGFYGTIRRQAQLGSLRLLEKVHAAAEVLPRHDHSSPYLSIVLSGGYRESTGDGSAWCGPGTLVLHPAGESHADVFGGGKSRLLAIEPPAELLAGPLGAAYQRRTVLTGIAATRLGAALCAELWAIDGVSELVVQGLLMELSGRVLRLSRPTARRRPAWLAEADALVRARFVDGVQLTALAEELGVHPSHLAREFRLAYGMSIGELVRRLRVEHAVERLQSGDSLADIAAACGFADQSHFTRCFRARLGVPPGVFRRRTRAASGS